MKKLLILLSSSLAAVGATAGTAMTVVSCGGNKADATKAVTEEQAKKDITAGLKKSYGTEELAKAAIEAFKDLKFTIKKVELASHTETSATFNLLLEAKKGYKLKFDGKLSFSINLGKDESGVVSLTKKAVDDWIKTAISAEQFETKEQATEKLSALVGNGFHVEKAEIGKEAGQKVTYNLSVVADEGYKLSFNGSTSIAVDVFNRDQAITQKFESLTQSNIVVDIDIKPEPIPARVDPNKPDEPAILTPVLTTRTKRSVDDVTVQQAKILEQVSALLEMDSAKYKVAFVEGSEYVAPSLVKNDANVIDSTTTVNLGKASIKLIKLEDGSELSTQVFNWDTKSYDHLLKLIKAFDLQNNGKQLDIILGNMPLLENITIGNLGSIVGMVSGIISPSLNEIPEWKLLDTDALAKADPTTAEGKKIYEDFQNNVVISFQKLLKTTGDLLSSLGIDSFEIGGQKVKIADLLDVNLFDIFGLKKETISLDQSISLVGKIPIKIDVKSQSGEYGIKIKDLIANIAPDLVDFVKFTLNENSFAKSKNVIFEFAKYLLKPVNQDLATINSKNFVDQTSGDKTYNYNKAKSNLDSMFYNLIFGFDSNKRNENANFSIKLNVYKDLGLLGKIDIDLYLSDLLKRINIEPSSIALDIANKFLKYDKSMYEGISLTDETSIFKGLKIIKDIDAVGLKKDGAILNGAAAMILQPEAINGLIGSFLPKVSPKTIADSFNKDFWSKLIDQKVGDNITSIKVDKGYLDLEFLDIATNKWVTLDFGMDSFSELEKYGNMRIIFKDFQLSGTYTSTAGEVYEFKTNDKISFELKLFEE